MRPSPAETEKLPPPNDRQAPFPSSSYRSTFTLLMLSSSWKSNRDAVWLEPTRVSRFFSSSVRFPGASCIWLGPAGSVAQAVNRSRNAAASRTESNFFIQGPPSPERTRSISVPIVAQPARGRKAPFLVQTTSMSKFARW